jgi:allantoin racemase
VAFQSEIQIRVVIPVLFSESLVEKARHEYDQAASPDVSMSYACIQKGTHTIESEFDLALAQPETIRECMRASDDGCDAAVIACFGDPGGAGAKEALEIPIVGEGEAALHLASMLGRRLAIITVRQETVPFMVAMTERAGLGSKLASVRPVDFGVMDFSLECIPDVVAQSEAAVTQDGADVIVMGCTGTGVDMAAEVSRQLAERVGAYVPVIDPVRAALGLAELCARHGYRSSERVYPRLLLERPEYEWSPHRESSTVELTGKEH